MLPELPEQELLSDLFGQAPLRGLAFRGVKPRRVLLRLLAVGLVVGLSLVGGQAAWAQEEPPPPEPVSCNVSLFNPGGAVTCAIEWLGSHVQAITTSVWALASTLVDKLNEVEEGIVSGLAAARDAITGAVGAVGTAIGDMADEVWSRLGEVRDGISGRLTEVSDWITAPLDELVAFADGLIEDLVDAFVDMLKELVEPDTAHRTALTDWWYATGAASPAGVLLTLTSLPAEFGDAAELSLGTSCPATFEVNSESAFNLCDSIQGLSEEAEQYKMLIYLAVASAFMVTLYRRLGDVVSQG